MRYGTCNRQIIQHMLVKYRFLLIQQCKASPQSGHQLKKVHQILTVYNLGRQRRQEVVVSIQRA